MEHPMSDDERTLLLGQNLYDGGSYDEAIVILQPVLTDHAAAEKNRNFVNACVAENVSPTTCAK